MKRTAIPPQPCHSPVSHQPNPLAEKRVRWALLITLLMMLAEISGGWWFQSMALLVDGWHMAVDALALGLALLAYLVSRYYREDGRFAFGSWKIEVLGAYTSAILLLVAAVFMAGESLLRFFQPANIRYDDALLVAVLGLVANLLCAWLLRGEHHHLAVGQHDHSHDHDHDHDHDHKSTDTHTDINRHAAFIHMLADALTSVLAIAALLGGRYLGLYALDPLMGLVGALVILVWGVKLTRQCFPALLDAEMGSNLVRELRAALLESRANLKDIHVWQVGPGQYACILTLAEESRPLVDTLRRQLESWPQLVHLTLEIG